MNRSLILLALVLGLLSQTTQAQETSYLLKDSTRLGAYIGPGYQMTAIGGQFSGQFTLKGGFVLDNKFQIGAHFAEMINEMNPATIPSDLNVDQEESIDISYNEAGLDFFYSPKATETIHLSYGFTTTWGKMQLKNDDTDLGEASVACVIPSINIGVKLMPWLKFQAGFGYRIGSQLNGFEDYDLNDRAFNAPNAQFGFYLGRY
jgi:hypothetical protein